MPSRASHVKSRHGCQQCKKRRIKCDEAHPICQGCTKHRIPCSFSSPPPPNPHSQIADPVSPTHLLDLKLLHQFTSDTCISLTDLPNLQYLYQTEVVNAAFKYDYLLHALLALAAFHLFRKELSSWNLENALHDQNQPTDSPSSSHVETYLLAGRKHHNQALQLLNQSLPSITQENCHAIFLASALVFVGFSAISTNDEINTRSQIVQSSSTSTLNQRGRTPSTTLNTSPTSSPFAPHPHTTLSRVLEWMSILRGIFAIILPANEWITAGPLADMVRRDLAVGERLAAGKVDALTDSKLTSFSSFLLSNPSTSPTTAEVCQNAIALLRKYIVVVEGGMCMSETQLLWPLLASDEFLTCLRNGFPEALVVLGFFGVLLGKTELKWYLQGWPQYVVRAVEMNLRSDWRVWVEWPLGSLELEPMSR